MKHSKKHLVNVQVLEPRSAGRASSAEVHVDEATSTLFAGIHASKRFTAKAAHQAFAGVKREK